MDQQESGWNKVPDKLLYLIQALRGGSETVIDRNTGKIKSQRFFSPNEGRNSPAMPRNMREYQLHNQEAMLGLQPKKTYEEWSKER